MNDNSLSRRLFSTSLIAAACLPNFARSQPAPAALIVPKHGRGGVPPVNLIASVKRQNAISERALRLLRALPGAAPPAQIFQPTMQAADWSKAKKVTPPKNQYQCGSCWDFAAVGAFESAYCIANNTSVDFSEQYVLDCNYAGYGCDGGWPDAVFTFLASTGGALTASYNAYSRENPGPGICHKPSGVPYIADTWGYVDGPNVLVDDDLTLALPSDVALKTALCEHGPIAVGVCSAGWDPYNGGVFVGSPSVPKLTRPTASQIDHVVLLTGWDNSLGTNGAWLIKNSWGQDWGEKGFMKLAFGTANLGFASVWIKARSLSARLALTPQILNRLQAINLGLPAN